MPRFRLAANEAIDLYFPAGHAESLHVDPGQEVDVPGDLAPDQPTDAYVVGVGDDARAWPKALWTLVEDTPPPDTPAPAGN